MDTLTHHLAHRLTHELAICGSEHGDLSLDAYRVTCEDCRRICGLGPMPEADDTCEWCENTHHLYVREYGRCGCSCHNRVPDVTSVTGS